MAKPRHAILIRYHGWIFHDNGKLARPDAK